MADSLYEVTFIGTDYGSIEEAAKSATIFCGGHPFYLDEQGRMLEKTEHEEMEGFPKTVEEPGGAEADGQVAMQKAMEKPDNGTAYGRLLLTFLHQIAPKGFIGADSLFVNQAKGPGKRVNRKLFDPLFGGEHSLGYFGGIVGIIRQTISLPKSFLLGRELSEDVDDTYHFLVTLEIRSRLDVDEQGRSTRPFFLTTMLLRDKLDLTDNTVPNSENEIYDYLLLFWFREQLQASLLKGYFRTYQRFEKNDDRPHGSVDIARHIRQNMGQNNGRVAYSYREKTIHNPLNRLILLAYDHLKFKYEEMMLDNFDQEQELKGAIDFLKSELRSEMSGGLRDIIVDNLQPISHPYFTEYENLRQTCLRILRDESISLFDGTSATESGGLLFYIPDLWELFLEDHIFDGMKSTARCDAQGPVDSFGCWDEAKGIYRYYQNTYPDFVLSHKGILENRPFMILDAKFKPKWDNVLAKQGSSVSEVMEDYNKCIRDMVSIGACATGVIFPTNRLFEVSEKNLIHPISEYNKQAFFYTIPIHIPVVDQTKKEYEKWLDAFETEVTKGRKLVEWIVDRERQYDLMTDELRRELARLTRPATKLS